MIQMEKTFKTKTTNNSENHILHVSGGMSVYEFSLILNWMFAKIYLYYPTFALLPCRQA